MVRLSTVYRLPGNWHALSIGGSANWQSDMYGIGNRPVGREANGGVPFARDGC